ncbi:hypothetical protein NFI95_02055 [Acetobacteraceae bacterium KSS8]|uniref:DUF2339 domain-containing protein n=1 Tax=Endosaccharibacter trunci TaxID=2812733 RepID=A0ABT1W5Z6_9PROT|nr:hypothetical protein [Acetobacteraceae bacterium KSS8]
MALNLPLPDWVPWWAQLVILILAILFGFAFLMMPFAVFGLKGRLDFLEAQLDDIHAELRMIATRLPEPDRAPPREPVFEEMTRPAARRSPSPVQMPDPAGSPHPEQRRATFAPEPPPMPEPPRPAERPAPTPRFAEAREPAPLRYARPPDERASLHDAAEDWDDPESPRRPLRATTLRDPSRERFREGSPGGDRPRSEPTLRWPSR